MTANRTEDRTFTPTEKEICSRLYTRDSSGDTSRETRSFSSRKVANVIKEKKKPLVYQLKDLRNTLVN